MNMFCAIVSNTEDTSETFEPDGKVLRSARFTLRSAGQCPWPPHQLTGHIVAVAEVGEMIAILRESAGILNTHLEGHQVDGEVKAHLERVADLVARLERRQSFSSSKSSRELMGI